MLTPKEIAEAAVKALDSKKAKDIKVLETKDVVVRSRRVACCESEDFRVGFRIQWLYFAHGFVPFYL